jgi:hypothetical protein
MERTLNLNTPPARIEEREAEAGGQSWPLPGDFESFFSPLETRKLRTAVFDLESHEFRSSCAISNRVVVADDKSGRGWNTDAPSFARAVEQLSQSAVGEVLVKKLGLHRSLYVWRIERRVVVVAEVSNVGPLPTEDVDAALVKEICGAAIHARQTGAASRGHEAASRAPSGIDPRSQRARSPWVKAGWACVLAMLACAALGAWLLTTAVPGAHDIAAKTRSEMSRLRALMDTEMTHGLSLAMSKGDYGEVQEMLSTYADSGYVSQAAVTNAKERVVAIAGDWSKLQIGASVPDDVLRAAQTMDLRLGSENFGRLLIPRPPRTTPSTPIKSDPYALRAASAWLCGLSLVAAVMLSAYLLRSGRSRLAVRRIGDPQEPSRDQSARPDQTDNAAKA